MIVAPWFGGGAWLRARARAALAPMLGGTLAGRRMHITCEEYHRDPCEVPSLSSSIAYLLATESPSHAYAAHPRLGGGIENDETKRKDDGALLHRLMLGRGAEVEVVQAYDWRTNAAKDARDAARKAGKIPVLEHVYAGKAAIAKILTDKLARMGYVFSGESEVAVEWLDSSGPEGPVLCRSMFDHVDQHGRLFDLKIVTTANPIAVSRTFVDNGLDIQEYSYKRALGAWQPELAGRVDFTFLFCEDSPPYAILPAHSDGALRDIGGLRWHGALAKWQECLASKRWPGFSDGKVVTLEAPQYVVTRELGTWEQAA